MNRLVVNFVLTMGIYIVPLCKVLSGREVKSWWAYIIGHIVLNIIITGTEEVLKSISAREDKKRE